MAIAGKESLGFGTWFADDARQRLLSGTTGEGHWSSGSDTGHFEQKPNPKSPKRGASAPKNEPCSPGSFSVAPRVPRPAKETIIICFKIICTVEEEVKHVHVNCCQSERLVSVYTEIGSFLDDMWEITRYDHSFAYRFLFYDLLRVMRKGDFLIRSYTTPHWFKSVASRGVDCEAFEDIHVELQLCLQTFHSTLPKLEERSPFFRALLHRTWRKDLKSDAKQDCAHCLLKLNSVGKRLQRGISQFHRDEDRGRIATESIKVIDEELRLLWAATEKVKESEDILTATKGDVEPNYLQIDPSDITLGKEIGTGAYGEVHEATWLSCKFAVKLLQTKNVSALQREVGILSKLRHPHIVQLVGFSVDKTMSLILMERMDGDLHRAIKDRMRSPPFSMDISLSLLSQIAAGMAYLHNQGVFHGDLKASNVLTSFKGNHGDMEVKISDFGVSQRVKLERRISLKEDCTPSNFEAAPNDPEIVKSSREHWRVAFSSREHSDVYSSSSFSGTVGTTCWRAPEVFPLQSQNYGERASTRIPQSASSIRVLEVYDGDIQEDVEFVEMLEEADADDFIQIFTEQAANGEAPVERPKIEVEENLTNMKAAKGETAVNSPKFEGEKFPAGNAAEKAVEKEPTYTAKADVYSYAMTCYEILTGDTPFADYRRSTIYEKIIAGDRPELPSSLPTSLSSLIKACWDTDPDKRPTFLTICEELRNIQDYRIQTTGWQNSITQQFNSMRDSCKIS